jgi:predicted ATPase
VGRGEHLATLSDVVARAIDFQAPQLVTVVGNQGTGKTRLIHELVPILGQNHEQACRVYHGAAERDQAGEPVRHAALTSLLRDRFEQRRFAVAIVAREAGSREARKIQRWGALAITHEVVESQTERDHAKSSSCSSCNSS